jgi:adenylylsulfate kinase
MRVRGLAPVLLDGDELRAALGVQGGYDLDSRRDRAFVYARLCRLLAGQGHPVICAAIALFDGVHRWNREHQARYLEVFLDVPLTELRRRDPKGIYREAGRTADVMGDGLPAEFPRRPDLVIRNAPPMTPEDAAEMVLRQCQERGFLPAAHPVPIE